MGDRTDEIETQILVTKLLSGQASQEERDKALANVMLSLWGQKELKELIRMVHNEECAKCPLKQASHTEEPQWQKIALLLAKYGGWLIVIIAALLKVSLH